MNTSTERSYRLGIDIGGTKICGVLLDQDNLCIEDYRLATPKDNLNHFLIIIKSLFDNLADKAARDNCQIASVGIGIAGTVDPLKQKVSYSPNLPIINNIKIVDKIRQKLDSSLPIKLDNDANCFTRAEAQLGAGKHFDIVYGITIGTGIGGALAINGQIYKGAHGAAGEPGNMLVDLDNKINLETAYQRLTQNNSRLMAQEAYEGDPLAEQAFKELGEYLGLAFANLVNLVDPGIIIIGGGATGSSDLFLSTAKKQMSEHIASPEAKKIKIVKAKLGDRAGAIGAALLF